MPLRPHGGRSQTPRRCWVAGRQARLKWPSYQPHTPGRSPRPCPARSTRGAGSCAAACASAGAGGSPRGPCSHYKRQQARRTLKPGRCMASRARRPMQARLGKGRSLDGGREGEGDLRDVGVEGAPAGRHKRVGVGVGGPAALVGCRAAGSGCGRGNGGVASWRAQVGSLRQAGRLAGSARTTTGRQASFVNFPAGPSSA